MSVNETRLPNGLRVISDHMGHLETVSVGVWVDVGARYEPLPLNGISHLLEHMAFKGTKRRSPRQLAEEIESVGGYLNAYTSREHTTYYARVLKGDLRLAVDILGDILLNSVFKEKELIREKDVIIQEIGQAQDTPDDIVFDNLQETAFPDQPLGRSILGTSQSVLSFTPDCIRDYMNNHYVSETMVISAAGNVDHDELVKMVEEYFSNIKKSRKGEFYEGEYKGGEYRDNRALEQLHITIGLPSFSFDDPDYYALQVYNTILGGGMSSRLFQEVREERGLAYSVYSFTSSHKDTGLFGIYAGTSPQMAGDLIPVIAGEMKRLIEVVEDDDLARARAQLKAGLLMSLESTSSRIEQLGRQMLIFGRPIPIEELIQEVDAIDGEAISRVAQRTLDGKVTLATVGDSRSLKDLDSISLVFQ